MRFPSLPVLAALPALALACADGGMPVAAEPDTIDPAFAPGAPAGGEPFDIAEVFFEFNTTDDDLGFQVLLDADGWDHLWLTDGSNRPLGRILAQGVLGRLGITELRFESAEPSPAEVLALFPAGTYALAGRTVEGDPLFSTAVLSHVFVAPPTLFPSAGESVDPGNAVVTWGAPGAARVEIIIQSEEVEGVFDVIVPGSVTSLTVPPEFLAPGVVYRIEILAIAANGNRTIVEGTFETSD